MIHINKGVDIIGEAKKLDCPISLNLLSSGQAQIAYLVGCPIYVRRLEEMGLRPGTKLYMIRPGKSCIIRVRGNRLCFRHSNLLDIMVYPDN